MSMRILTFPIFPLAFALLYLPLQILFPSLFLLSQTTPSGSLRISLYQTHQPKYFILFNSPISCFLKKFLLSHFNSTIGFIRIQLKVPYLPSYFSYFHLLQYLIYRQRALSSVQYDSPETVTVTHSLLQSSLFLPLSQSLWRLSVYNPADRNQ